MAFAPSRWSLTNPGGRDLRGGVYPTLRREQTYTGYAKPGVLKHNYLDDRYGSDEYKWTTGRSSRPGQYYVRYPDHQTSDLTFEPQIRSEEWCDPLEKTEVIVQHDVGRRSPIYTEVTITDPKPKTVVVFKEEPPKIPFVPRVDREPYRRPGTAMTRRETTHRTETRTSTETREVSDTPGLARIPPTSTHNYTSSTTAYLPVKNVSMFANTYDEGMKYRQPTLYKTITTPRPEFDRGSLASALLTGFQMFDVTNSGYISRASLIKVLGGFNIRPEDILAQNGHDWMRERINYRDFLSSFRFQYDDEVRRREIIPAKVVVTTTEPVTEHWVSDSSSYCAPPTDFQTTTEYTDNYTDHATSSDILDRLLRRTEDRTRPWSASQERRPCSTHTLRKRYDKPLAYSTGYVSHNSDIEKDRTLLLTLLRKVRSTVLSQQAYLKTFFQTRDRLGMNHISKGDMKICMERLFFNLTLGEREILCQFFDLHNNGRFHYARFMECIHSRRSW